MCEYVLDRIRKLECIHGSEAELHMGVDNEFREAENFTAQVKHDFLRSFVVSVLSSNQ